MNTYMKKHNAVVLFLDGEVYNIDESHKFFKEISDELRKPIDLINWTTIQDLVDRAKAVEVYTKGNIKFEGLKLTYKGRELKNYAVDKLFELKKEGYDVQPMLNFLENLMKNPSHQSVNELYMFLEVCNLPITPDGHFIAYKVIRNDWKDCHSGTMDNSIGATPKMDRNEVDDNRDRTCSKGLHFASKEYLQHFHSGNNRLVAVKVNPEHVVSIPSDYNNSKGRACEYLILKELKYGEHVEEVEAKPLWTDNNGMTHRITSERSKFAGHDVKIIETMTAKKWNKENPACPKTDKQCLVEHRNGSRFWMNEGSLELLEDWS